MSGMEGYLRPTNILGPVWLLLSLRIAYEIAKRISPTARKVA